MPLTLLYWDYAGLCLRVCMRRILWASGLASESVEVLEISFLLAQEANISVVVNDNQV